MGLFSKKKENSKQKLDRLVREARKKTERRVRLASQPRGFRPASRQPRGWFF